MMVKLGPKPRRRRAKILEKKWGVFFPLKKAELVIAVGYHACRIMVNMSDSSNLIQQGDAVIVRMHDDKSTCIIKVQGDAKICRSKVSTKGLVGVPYGTVFQIAGRQLVQVKDEKELDILDAPTEYFAASSSSSSSSGSSSSSSSSSNGMENGGNGGEDITTVIAGDNRGYADTNTAQKLTPDEIKQMRQSGATPKAIIQQLIAHR